MVLLHFKQPDEHEFLIEARASETAAAVTARAIQIWNARLALRALLAVADTDPDTVSESHAAACARAAAVLAPPTAAAASGSALRMYSSMASCSLGRFSAQYSAVFTM